MPNYSDLNKSMKQEIREMMGTFTELSQAERAIVLTIAYSFLTLQKMEQAAAEIQTT